MASLPGFQYLRIMDATFGVGMAKLDFFAIMYVHPTTQVSVALAHFLRLKGTDDAPHPLIPDLVWMQEVLERDFGMDAPRYVIVDKCKGSLGAFATEVKAKWRECADASGRAAGALKDVLETLTLISSGVTPPEEAALAAYLADAVATHGTSLPVPSAAGVVISPSAVAAAAEYFGPWASQHPTLVRALAKHLSAELLDGAAAVASAETLAGAINDALAKLQRLAWVVADNDSALSALFRRLVERWIRLCYFHAKKAIKEHTQKHGTIPAKDFAVVWVDEIEPSLDAIFGAPPGDGPTGLDTLWANFKVDYGARYPNLVSYLAEHWMSPEWLLLWTGSGRFSIGHFFVNTSNPAEGYFRQSKSGPVMGGQMPSDPIVLIEQLIGLPTNPSSIEMSYFMAQYIKISDILSRATNMRLPARTHISALRISINELLAAEGAVRDVTGAEGVLYDVVTKAGRAAPALLFGGVVETRRLSLYHGCPCSDPNFFCKCLLAARIVHLRKGRARCWRDKELSPFFNEDGVEPASVDDLFASVAESAATAVADITPAAARAAYDAQSSVLTAKANALVGTLNQLASDPPPVLGDDATRGEVAELAARALTLGRLAERMTAVERLAAALAGRIPVAAGSARQFARSARSKEEVDERPTVPLVFSGALSPAAAVAGMVRFAEPTGAGAGAGAAKRGRVDAVGGAGAPPAGAAAASSSIAELKKKISQINARVERRNTTIQALNEELESKQRELDYEEERVRGLEREVVTATEEAAVAAYEDSAQRVRDVKEAWYMRNPDICEAFDLLERRLRQLVREEGQRMQRLRERFRDLFRDRERRRHR